MIFLFFDEEIHKRICLLLKVSFLKGKDVLLSSMVSYWGILFFSHYDSQLVTGVLRPLTFFSSSLMSKLSNSTLSVLVLFDLIFLLFLSSSELLSFTIYLIALFPSHSCSHTQYLSVYLAFCWRCSFECYLQSNSSSELSHSLSLSLQNNDLSPRNHVLSKPRTWT